MRILLRTFYVADLASISFMREQSGIRRRLQPHRTLRQIPTEFAVLLCLIFMPWL